MTLSKRGCIAALVLAVLGGAASAQAKLTVNPDPLTAGGTAEINYSDPSRAGQTVLVTIDGPGFPVPTVVTVSIQLDGNGDGGTKWQVPEWAWALFNAPGVCEVVREILPGVTDVDGM